MKKLMLTVAMAALVAGCNPFDRGRGPTTPTYGARQPVLTAAEATLTADTALAAVPVVLPGPVQNMEWAQPGGNAAKSMVHVALGASPARLWSASIGSGSGPRGRLAAEPVVADGKVFTIDTQAVVRAFDATTGGQLWSAQVRGEQATSETLFGGGVSYDGGRLYVTNGAGYATALDAGTGAQVWQTRVGGPLRGAPTVAAGTVYVVSQDNQVYAIAADTGRPQWTGTGTVELAGVFGAAAPAFAQSTVVAGFSSGELTAYRYENGQVVWQDALSRTGISTIVGNISDIDADPVIDNGRVFSVGQGGRMVAVELISGQRAWELNVAGISTPWVSGDWVFVITDRAQLLAVTRAAGRIRWISQLQGFRVPERRSEPDRRTGQVTVRPGQGPIFWRGPVLAGGRLVLTGSNGQIVFADPATGAITATIAHNQPINLAPVVANGVMYVLDETGTLTAYR
jgi:outer membrane protein assembly factor BamB